MVKSQIQRQLSFDQLFVAAVSPMPPVLLLRDGQYCETVNRLFIEIKIEIKVPSTSGTLQAHFKYNQSGV